MKNIESILVKNYNLRPTLRELTGSRCIVADNLYMTCVIAMPGYLDFSEKWIVRFIPSIPYFSPGGCERIELGAMIEERFGSKKECIKYLKNNDVVVFKRLYLYALNTIREIAKSIDEIYDLDPSRRGEFMEVLG